MQIFDVPRVRRAVAVIGMMPVGLRIVGAPVDAAAAAGIGEQSDDVLAVGRFRAGDLVVGEFRIELAEAVVVLGGEDQVLHAGVFGELHPLVGVELHRVEHAVEVVVDLDRHVAGLFLRASAAFAAARPADFGAHDAHRTPVNEHAEAKVFPAFDGGFGRSGVGASGAARGEGGQRRGGQGQTAECPAAHGVQPSHGYEPPHHEYNKRT